MGNCFGIKNAGSNEGTIEKRSNAYKSDEPDLYSLDEVESG